MEAVLVLVLILVTVSFVGLLKYSKEKIHTKETTTQSHMDFSTFKEKRRKESSFSGVFNETFLALAAFVIKSDDDVAYSELVHVRNYFRTYYPGDEELYFGRLNLYLKQDININNTCKAILNAGFNDKFQMMTQLFNIALADGQIYISEYVALYDIFNLLNLPNLTFITIRELFGITFTHREVIDFKEQSFRKEIDDWSREYEKQKQQSQEEQQKQQEQYRKKQKYHNYYYQQKSKNKSFATETQSELDSAYIILGIKKGATLNEIKKAFRKLAHLHHPDKVAHLGEGSVKQADVIFRKIKDAYELIIRSLS